MGLSKLMTRDWPTRTLIWTGSLAADASSNDAPTEVCRCACAGASGDQACDE
jgi:hypothetical protein